MGTILFLDRDLNELMKQMISMISEMASGLNAIGDIGSAIVAFVNQI